MLSPEGRPPLRIVPGTGCLSERYPEREILIAQAEKGNHGDPAWRCGAPALVADLEAKKGGAQCPTTEQVCSGYIVRLRS